MLLPLEGLTVDWLDQLAPSKPRWEATVSLRPVSLRKSLLRSTLLPVDLSVELTFLLSSMDLESPCKSPAAKMERW